MYIIFFLSIYGLSIQFLRSGINLFFGLNLNLLIIFLQKCLDIVERFKIVFIVCAIFATFPHVEAHFAQGTLDRHVWPYVSPLFFVAQIVRSIGPFLATRCSRTNFLGYTSLRLPNKKNRMRLLLSLKGLTTRGVSSLLGLRTSTLHGQSSPKLGHCSTLPHIRRYLLRVDS